MALEQDAPICIKDKRDLPFCQVDNSLMRLPRLDPYAKAVYVLFCGYMNFRTLGCFPSLDTICMDLNISRPTAVKAIKALIAEGVLELVKRRDSKGRVLSNVYLIKDWRSEEEPAQVNVVNSDVHGKVNDVDTDSKRRLLSPSVSQVNDVYCNDIDLKRYRSNENQVSDFADSQNTPPDILEKTDTSTPAKKAVKKPKKETDPRVNEVFKAIEEAYGDIVPHPARQCAEIAGMLRNRDPIDIVNCWKWKSAQRNGAWVDLVWVTKDIGDWLRGRLPGQKGPNNGRADSRPDSGAPRNHTARDAGADPNITTSRHVAEDWEYERSLMRDRTPRS